MYEIKKDKEEILFRKLFLLKEFARRKGKTHRGNLAVRDLNEKNIWNSFLILFLIKP